VEAKNRIARLYRRSLELIVVLGAPAYVLSAILAPAFLKLWLGDKFVETLPGVFRIVLLGILVSALGIPASCTLIGTGHVRHNLMANVVLTVTNMVVVLCILAVSPVTTAAVAWCSSAAMAAATLYLIVQERRVLHNATVS
jgi:O-antigen/teichoic acid export membrane protein